MALYRLPFGPPGGGLKFVLGLGNWDDPNSGAHQAYGWDFVLTHPVLGGMLEFTVRAARAGVVHFVENTATDSETPSGGAGNNVQILHADGTNAAYCHFKKGSIVVIKGQWVAQGQALGTAGTTGNSSGIHLHYDVHTGACDPDLIRPLMLTHFEDAGHTAWRPFVGDTFATNNTVTRQDEWRQCIKCQMLAFSKNSGSNCPEGGGHSYGRYGGNFTLTHNRPDLGEPEWHHCHKCQSLFYGSSGGTCPESGGHSSAFSGNYSLMSSSFPSAVGGWRWCWQCHGLFLLANQASSTCAAGGTHQQAIDGGTNYFLHCTLPDLEKNWRFCNKCAGLFYHPNVSQSTCPSEGTHNAGNTGNYHLTLNSTDAPGQANWRWCSKCQGLFFGGNTGSVCAEGGAHSSSGSASYVLVNSTASDAPGEALWRWCSKCQGLWYGEAASVCPAGGAHTKTGSGNYRLVVQYV